MTFLKNFSNSISCFCIAVLLVFFSACNSSDTGQQFLVTIMHSDGSATDCLVELALSAEERSYGFMERTSIPDGTGMLFVFPGDQHLSFWMKNTPSALSIAYVDSDGKIREIHDMRPFSTASVNSSHSVRYALEVPVGWFAKEHIELGDRLQFSDELIRLFRTVSE